MVNTRLTRRYSNELISQNEVGNIQWVHRIGVLSCFSLTNYKLGMEYGLYMMIETLWWKLT